MLDYVQSKPLSLSIFFLFLLYFELPTRSKNIYTMALENWDLMLSSSWANNSNAVLDLLYSGIVYLGSGIGSEKPEDKN